MNKKVIALSLVIVLLATTFAACGKIKNPIIELDGNEYVLATDDEGNTIVDDEGNFIVHPTDNRGKIIKDEDGVPQTNKVEFNEVLVDNGAIETAHFKFSIKEPGWTLGEDGAYYKDGTNNNVSIKISDYGVYEDGKTFEDDFNEGIKNLNMFADEVKKEYPKTTVESDNTIKLTDGNLTAGIGTLKVVSEDGKVQLVMSGLRFEINGKLYSIEFSCKGEYYDESFDLIKIANESITLK